MPYQFINARLDGVVSAYLTQDLHENFDYLLWIEEIAEDGFKTSLRYNPDYSGFSVTITDARSNTDAVCGFSSWGSTLGEALAEAYLKLDVLAERGDIRKLPKLIKDLEKQISAELHNIKLEGLTKLTVHNK